MIQDADTHRTHNADRMQIMSTIPSRIGPYRIVRQLGEGGMGAVFEAVHEQIERRVAIKVILPEYARDAEFTARFFNEARVVNRVGHPGLVQISDYGRLPDGTAYIVMEFLEGETLARRLGQPGGKLSLPEVIQLGWQLADSLAAAHDKGVVHRDLKPENVMIVPDPYMANGERTKLLDFGIAKVAEPGALELTQGAKTKANQVMGTPDYMSPEQCAGAAGVDGKSDVYSLGVMLFRMLAGRSPFVAETSSQIMGMHMFVAPPLLRDLAPKVPPSLAELVHRMLAKNADARLTMRQMAAILERLGEQYPLPKRSASNEAIRLDELDHPDATILVGQKKSFTLNEEPATPNTKTVQSGPRLRRRAMLFGTALRVIGRASFLARRPLMIAVGLVGGAAAAGVLTWLGLHALQDLRMRSSAVHRGQANFPSVSNPGTESPAHQYPPRPAVDLGPVEPPGATSKSPNKAPDGLPQPTGSISPGPMGKPGESTKVPSSLLAPKKRPESEKNAQAMLDLGKSSCRQRNVDKANSAVAKLETDKFRQKELIDYCVQNGMHEGSNGKLFMLKIPF